MSHQDRSDQPPRWTFAGFRAGVIGMLPLLPGLMAFGMAFGTVAARKGFTITETVVMNATVYAGMAQMIVLESWPEKLTLSAIAAVSLITAMVCMRFLLIGASLRPWLGGEPAARVYPTLYLLTEPNWIRTLRYRAEGGSDPAFLLGSGVIVWVAWVIAPLPGYWLGTAVADPSRFGLDLIMPAFFTAMLVPLWRGRRRAIGWVVAGVVALITDMTIGGVWFVFTGSVAGAIAGGLLADE
jgi:predicted branched-subunit amino acid permease